MRIRPLCAVLAGCFASGALSAQADAATDVAPRIFTGTFAGAGSFFPFARSGGLVQYWWRGDNFRPGQVVSALGIRPQKGRSSPPVTLQSVEIKLSNTTNPFTNVFASNFGPQVTTLFTAKPVSLPALTPPHPHDRPALWLAADSPFLATGENVVCAFDLGSAVGSVDLSHVADAFWMGAENGTLHVSSGVACGSGRLTGFGLYANFYVLKLTSAPANAPAALMIGIDHTRLLGQTPLPLPLDDYGFPGCFLGVDPLLTVQVTTDAAGASSHLIAFSKLPRGYTLFAQAVHPDIRKPAGLATTNVAHSLLGGSGLANSAFNSTVDGPVAQYGPFATDGGAVILFR